MKKLVLGALGATAVAYYLRDRLRALLGRGRDTVQEAGAQFTSSAPSFGGGDPNVAGDPDDATLAHKVETELFRDDSVPKGQINVNAQFGRIQLRGEVPSEEMIQTLVERTRQVDGVTEVESLLHLPGQDAPMHQ